MRTLSIAVAATAVLLVAATIVSNGARPAAAETLPWQKAKKKPVYESDGAYAPEPYDNSGEYAPEPLPGAGGYKAGAVADDPYASDAPADGDYGGYGVDEPKRLPKSTRPTARSGVVYEPEPVQEYAGTAETNGYRRTYEMGEITAAGHRFFGSVSQDLASVIEYAFRRSGRPNGYILGEEGGGAFVAGLRYGEGVLYTKDAGERRVYWQGPSIGYDFGAEGSRTMILVYNLRHPDDIYANFGGLSGSAYLVGGVGITYLTDGKVTTAPIRSGLGLRLGANVGYLKYTQTPTWNPF